MDSTRWAEVEAIFHELADRPLADQSEALSQLDASDPALVADVRAMLEADAAGRSLLDRTPGAMALALLGRDDTLPAVPFGPYRLASLLGEGGMGVVYLGRRDDLGALAAIKVLRNAWLSPGRRERFLVEQRTLASLEHPGIARLLDADRLDDGTPWFAMEYVEGETITAYAARHQLSLTARLALYRQVCEAVRFAHERGVIHRDIKPSNVLVNGAGTVKLLDFGIAKSTSGIERKADATRTQHQLMTPAYAAPEQLRGAVVGVQADVFALGVLLFELLTGQRPWTTAGLSTHEAAEHIETRAPDRVSTLRARSGGTIASAGLRRSAMHDLDALVACAIHADTQRRYRSVDALLSDLTRFDQQQPLAAQPDSVGYRVRKLLARRWREIGIAAAAVLLSAAGIASYTIGLNQARLTAEAETARVRRMRDFLVSMFDGGDAQAGPSNELRVRDIVDNGIRESRALTTDPSLQAELFGVLGFASGQLGAPAQADTLLRAALAMKRRVFGATSREAIEAAVVLAQQEQAVGHTDSVLPMLRTAYRMARTALSETEPVRATTTEAFGAALALVDSADAAIPLLQEAVRLRAAVDSNSVEYSNALSALADGYYYAEAFEKADTLNRIVIRRVERELGKDHPSIANNYVNLGQIAMRDGRYADAESHARAALAICQRYYGAEHTRTAAAMKNVAEALMMRNAEREALPMLRSALAVQEKVLGPDAGPVATTLNLLAAAEINTGEAASGIGRYVRATQIFGRLYGDSHPHTLVARANLASTLLRAQLVDSAATVLADVVRIAAASLDSTHQDLAIFRIRLGRARLAQKRYRDVIESSTRGLRSLEATQTEPTSFSRAARKDLREAYLALGDASGAARFSDPDGRMTPRAPSVVLGQSPR